MSNRRIMKKRQKRMLDGLRQEFDDMGFPAGFLARIRTLTAGVPIDHDAPIDGAVDLMTAMQGLEAGAAVDRAPASTGEQVGRAAVNAAFDAALRAVGEDIAHGPAAAMTEAELIAAADAAKRAVRRERRSG